MQVLASVWWPSCPCQLPILGSCNTLHVRLALYWYRFRWLVTLCCLHQKSFWHGEHGSNSFFEAVKRCKKCASAAAEWSPVIFRSPLSHVLAQMLCTKVGAIKLFFLWHGGKLALLCYAHLKFYATSTYFS
mgnify:CR=1 FL=1